MEDFSLRLRKYDVRNDRRLGRQCNHDSRSLRYQVRAQDPATLKSIKHKHMIGTLDQLNLGSCTGNSSMHAMGTEAFWSSGKTVLKNDPIKDEEYAVGVYSDATKIDPWAGEYKPDDTGSDGLSVAKVLKTRGLISGYQHATSLEAALTALAERPVLIGSDWLSNMYNPRANGQLMVTGTVDGGHEYCLDELDVENKRVWIWQTWGPGWGQSGRAWITWTDLGKLLSNYGDCTILVPKTEPPPQPEPVKPLVTDKELKLEIGLRQFLMTKYCPDYLRRPAVPWLDRNK